MFNGDHNRNDNYLPPMNQPGPILIVERFAPLRQHLLTLLADLHEDEWTRATAAPGWSVKDLAAHLVGGDMAILSGKRDGFRSTEQIDGYDQLVALVDCLNREWVVAARRLSLRLLQELLAFCGPEVEACFASLDPVKLGTAVSWAGPDPAPIWFDLAREFTERWHHQAQIRDATARPPLDDPYFLGPVLDTFMRALPHSYRKLKAPTGTVVRCEISGSAGGIWYVVKATNGWTLRLQPPTSHATAIIIPQDIAWRLFTKGIDRQVARSLSSIQGKEEFAAPTFATTAIIG